MSMWKVNQAFKEGKKAFKRGDTIKTRPKWPNFDSMVATGLIELIEDPKEVVVDGGS